MRVRVLAFARPAELLGRSRSEVDLPDGATAADLWNALAAAAPALAPLAESTRFARNGRIVTGSEELRDGDEVALLPPVGGG